MQMCTIFIQSTHFSNLIYQLVPATGIGENNIPNTNFYLRIKEGMVIEANTTGTLFRTTELLDFNVEDEREITIYSKDGGGNADYYLVKKYVNAISAELKEVSVSFGSPQEFSKIDITDTNVIEIYDVRDSSGNKWYEVPYLAQEMVFVDYANSEQTDKNLVQFKDSVPNILKLLKTSRRFVTKVNADNTTTLVFGGGNSTSSDETLIPNFKNVGL